MTDQDQDQPAPQTPAQSSTPTEARDVGEARKALQGEAPPFFGSGTLEMPAGQVVPDVAPTSNQPATPADTSGSSGDAS